MIRNELYCRISPQWRIICDGSFVRDIEGITNNHNIRLSYCPGDDTLEIYECIREDKVIPHPYDKRKKVSSSCIVKVNTTVLYHPVMEDYFDCLSVDDVKQVMYEKYK